MAIGSYIFQKQGRQSLPPAHYGYHSIRWSFEAAQTSINALRSREFDKEGLISKLISNPFPGELQYMALIMAAYLTYGTQICAVPEQAVKELYRGVDDGLKDLRTPNDEPYDAELISFFKGAIGKYYRAQTKDLEANEHHFNVDSSNTAKEFVDMLLLSYSHKIDSVPDQLEILMHLNASATSIVLATYETLKDNFGLTYQQV